MVQYSKITILNVDDDDAGHYAITKILQHSGFAFREASTGEEALWLAQEEPYLILLDVNLPDNHTLLIAHDGIERPIADSSVSIRNSAGRRPINERQERLL